MANPFTMRVIPPESPFCDRTEELRELKRHAENRVNVVLFSPRRYGKTSLIKKVQSEVEKDGFLPFYVDLFMVTGIDEVAGRVAKGVYSVLHQRDSLLEKGMQPLKRFQTFRPVLKPSQDGGFALNVEPASTGLGGAELLDNVMEELGAFVQKDRARVHFVLDEFQEITELKESSIEGILRKHIQHHQASYVFVGSRRRVLLDIFNQRNRPFYQSALMIPLAPLPHAELVDFLMERFEAEGKHCPREAAESISNQTHQYPYYAQALAYNVFELSGDAVRVEDVDEGFETLLSSERYGYEAVIQGLTGAQTALLRALAASPSAHILSRGFLARHKLSLGGVQSAQKKLAELDLIERHEQVWRLVDPVFAEWLSRYS